MSKPKYKQGKQVTSVAQFDESEARFFKWHNKTLHRGFITAWQYHFLKVQIECGALYEADFIEERNV